MKNVLNHADTGEGITMVQRLSILVENRSQRGREPLGGSTWRVGETWLEGQLVVL